MNAEQAMTSINSLQTIISVQQQQNASLISMAELLDSALANRTEVVSYHKLSHEELEAVANEYDIMLTHLRNIFYNVSRITMDNDSAFGNAKQFITDIEPLGKEVRKHD